ncbi:MAG: YvrJ family protein [Selenomonadaceae bacterium]|nr:YvrJ family protein [Selenomonadaceae bacterium]
MTEFMTVIGNYGFPMGVTAFLLVRIESKLGQLNESIQLLAKAIDRR